MEVKSKRTSATCTRSAIVAAVAGVLCFAAQGAMAADNGPTQIGEICMQKVYGTPVANSNRLNCTANDIRLSRAISVSPTTCISGTTFDLEATFETIVTANTRYDAGFFFRIDGGPNARGDGTSASGECSLSALDPTIAPALNLDGDTAGDLNSGTYALSFTIPNVVCADTDGDGFLNLPNCTSWHSNQGTPGSIDPFDAFTFNPDTKSKCVCDDDFQVPVTVESASIVVDKTASPTQIQEPGGEITFNVDITNNAVIESVNITSIVDDIHGDIGADTVSLGNTCDDLIGTSVGPGATVSCMFKADVTGNAGYRETDTVTAMAFQPSNNSTVQDDDDADVDIINRANDPVPSLDKTAQSVANCEFDATYQVVVNNNSTVDALTVNGLSDDGFGDITQVQGDVLSTTCGNLPALVEFGDNYTCQFTARVQNASCDFTHTNTVTADTVDDDNISHTPEDSAMVVVDVSVVP